MKELYVKKGDNEYEKVEFKDLLSLQFDYDGDGVLLITEENYLRLKMAVDLNDRYSVGNADNEKTAQYYIKNDYLKGGHLVNDIGVIKEVCKRIDKENSTHLSVVGNRKITALIIDPSAASFIETVRRHGKYRIIKADNDVLKGINRVCQALKDNEIYISPDCTDAIREFSIYRWDNDIKRDAPKKENDHAMDDIRYFVQSVIGKDKSDYSFSFAVERK